MAATWFSETVSESVTVCWSPLGQFSPLPTVSEDFMKNFNTLMLAIELHKECKKLETPHYLKDQLLRASSSVALNLSEGKGRKTPKDQKRFFDIAFGSLRETQTCLLLIEAPTNVIDLADNNAAHLYKLLKSFH